jgi:cation transport ATPase
MVYCSKCGVSLKAESVRRKDYEKGEKQEKHEKHEKEEKAEKHEKQEISVFWAFIGGLILVVIGGFSILAAFFDVPDPWRGAFFLVIIGVFIIAFAIYGAARASRRSPNP